VRRGEIVAVMGRNGSGKSTLLKTLVGLLKPQRGRVRILDRDIRNLPVAEIAQQVGLVPQNPQRLLFHETVAQELSFTRQAHGLPVPDASSPADRLGLTVLSDACPRDLSTGEQQRVALGAILAAEPEILLLDEPTRGIDALQKQQLADYLRELSTGGITILMASHDVELVARCVDRVVILGDGQVVVDGPLREVMTGSMVFASQINKLLRDPRFITVDDVLSQLS
jgi:energy-coupling factor transport system ATP-binding protein